MAEDTTTTATPDDNEAATTTMMKMKMMIDPDKEEDEDWTSVFADVTPIPQDDGPHPVCAIDYSPQFIKAYDYMRAILQTGEKSCTFCTFCGCYPLVKLFSAMMVLSSFVFVLLY